MRRTSGGGRRRLIVEFINQILVGDVINRLRELPDECVHTVVTSPPYWGLRDYGMPGQIGLEATPELFVERMVNVFREVRRVLRKDGTLWLNIGDSYVTGSAGPGSSAGSTLQGSTAGQDESKKAKGHSFRRDRLERQDDPHKVAPGLKAKDLVLMPARLALALQADGWWVRMDCIWAKPNPMPESITDRPTKSHEYLFLLSRSERYFYDNEAVREKSLTCDPRRPYGSEGSWQLDGRPPEQRHGGKVRSPAGWRTDKGSHGSVHPEGREQEVLYNEIDVTKRNLRSVWSIATEAYPDAHFATFPQKLVEPCILAGTSEGGCCVHCGSPYRREVEVQYENPGNRSPNGDRSKERKHLEHGTAGYDVRLERRSTTKGWKQTCDCPGMGIKPKAAVVLDPFMGSGTTALVALRARRDFVGIELNPAYAELARKRIEPELSQLKLC